MQPTDEFIGSAHSEGQNQLSLTKKMYVMKKMYCTIATIAIIASILGANEIINQIRN